MKLIRWSAAGILMSIGGIALLAMMGHVAGDVIGRSFFGAPIDGTLEIVSGYYMVAVVFLPLAFVTRNDDHIYVELFTRRMGAGRIALLDAAVEFLALLFVGFLAWQSAVEHCRWRSLGNGGTHHPDVAEPLAVADQFSGHDPVSCRACRSLRPRMACRSRRMIKPACYILDFRVSTQRRRC